MAFNFRKAEPQDFSSINGLVKKSVRVLQAPYYKEPEIETALEVVKGIEALIDSSSYFIAENKNSIIGCGGFYIDSLPSKEAEIRAFFIDPEFSRKGIAAQILLLCETYCSSKGIESLVLTSTLSGEPFYKKYGFVEISRFKQRLSNGQYFELVEMRKHI